MTAQTIDTNTVTALVADAATAPSLHNAQPWAFRYLHDVGFLLLYADPARALPRTDPDRRGLHPGCGAALCNLRVAATAAGLGPDVKLLPDPGDADFLAEVHLHGTARPDRSLASVGRSVIRSPTWPTCRWCCGSATDPKATRATATGGRTARHRLIAQPGLGGEEEWQ